MKTFNAPTATRRLYQHVLYAFLFSVSLLALISCVKNENPPEISDQEFFVDENSPKGTIIGVIIAHDVDENTLLGFSILEGNTDEAFSLDEAYGILSVNNSAAIDYEKTSGFSLKIRVSDNHPKGPKESEANIKVHINDLNEFSPVLVDHFYQIEEYPDHGFLIGQINATDDDKEQTLTYSIESGNENGALVIDSITGKLYVADSLQFDRRINQLIRCMISVCDNHPNDPKKSYALLTIEIKEGNIIVVDIQGHVQKGPYIQGSVITIYELDDEMEPTGRTFSSNITDNSGSFTMNNISLKSKYVKLGANGFYFNERTGKLSEAQLTLNCIADITNLEYTNINILSHIECERLKYLIVNGFSYDEAKAKAQQEVLSIFNISNSGLVQAELMDLSKEGEDNAILLAASVILQGYKSTGDFSELINRISADIREDGTLDNLYIGSELVNSVKFSNMARVRGNLDTRYNALGVSYTIPDFEKYVAQFLENTDFVPTYDLFPSRGDRGVNVLHPDTIAVYDINLSIAPQYSLAVDVPENRSMIFNIRGNGLLVQVSNFTNMGFQKIESDPDLFSFYTTSAGRCEYKIAFWHRPDDDSKILQFEYFWDDSDEPFFTKDVELITDWTPPPDSTKRKK